MGSTIARNLLLDLLEHRPPWMRKAVAHLLVLLSDCCSENSVSQVEEAIEARGTARKGQAKWEAYRHLCRAAKLPPGRNAEVLRQSYKNSRSRRRRR